MTTISLARFITEIQRWAAIRHGGFKNYWPVKGGWEGWIQVDLTAYLLSIDSTLEVLREQPVFENSRQRVDLLLNADQFTQLQLLVEIKAESFQNALMPFVNGTRDDYIKLSQNRTQEYANSSCMVLSFPFNQQSLDAVLGLTGANGEKLFGAIYRSSEIAICASVFERATGWRPPDLVADIDGNAKEGSHFGEAL